MTKELVGVPVPLKGSVQGLNLVGNGLPGLGFMAQLPVAYLLKNRPASDTLKQLFLPYGDPDSNPTTAILESYAPAWLKQAFNIMDNPASARDFGATVAGTMKYLASTGDYDLESSEPGRAAEEAARLVEDATEKAREVQAIRTVGAFSLPTSPSPEWLVHDKKGKLVLGWKMANWYQKRLKDTGDPDQALSDFLDRFGTVNLLTPQGRSHGTIPAADRLSSSAGSKWAHDNASLGTKYPNTYALFAPDSEDFDSAAYERAFERGERVGLSPKQMIVAANARLANLIYFSQHDDLEADGKIDDNDRLALRQLKRELLSEFPGFDPEKGGFPSQAKLFAELQNAVNDPKIKKTPAGKALKTYFGWRDAIIAQQGAAGLSTAAISSGKAVAPARRWLNEHGQALVEENPTFQPLWDLVLSREVEE
jgi:hypothetical protein